MWLVLLASLVFLHYLYVRRKFDKFALMGIPHQVKKLCEDSILRASSILYAEHIFFFFWKCPCPITSKFGNGEHSTYEKAIQYQGMFALLFQPRVEPWTSVLWVQCSIHLAGRKLALLFMWVDCWGKNWYWTKLPKIRHFLQHEVTKIINDEKISWHKKCSGCVVFT